MSQNHDHYYVSKQLQKLTGRIEVLDSVLGEATKTLEDLAAWSSRVEAVQKSVEGSLAALRQDIATLESRLEALEQGQEPPFEPEVGKAAWAIDTRGETKKRTLVDVERFMNNGKLAIVRDTEGKSFCIEVEALGRQHDAI